MKNISRHDTDNLLELCSHLITHYHQMNTWDKRRKKAIVGKKDCKYYYERYRDEVKDDMIELEDRIHELYKKLYA